MKVDGTDNSFLLPNLEKNKPAERVPDRTFRDIFQESLRPVKSQIASPGATAVIQRCVPPMIAEKAAPARGEVLERVEHLLDTLEEYRRHLARPETNLKSLGALLQRLNGQRQALEPAVNELPGSDGLKTILNQCLVTASVEMFKFQRGDYLAA